MFGELILSWCACDLNHTVYCNALEFEGHFVIVSRHDYKNSDLFQMILLYCIKINLFPIIRFTLFFSFFAYICKPYTQNNNCIIYIYIY